MSYRKEKIQKRVGGESLSLPHSPVEGLSIWTINEGSFVSLITGTIIKELNNNEVYWKFCLMLTWPMQMPNCICILKEGCICFVSRLWWNIRYWKCLPACSSFCLSHLVFYAFVLSNVYAPREAQACGLFRQKLDYITIGLQENIIHLNLSYNHFTDLHNQLTQYTNLRTLDISNNRLESLPAQLPRSLWNISAANNNIKLLEKSDTAYQWNLKYLDVSKNMLEKVVLIKNTLRSLEVLSLSSNKLWTVPTNMPSKLHTVDLSNNSLTQILPGTLINLTNLTHLYLHNNKFTFIPDQSFWPTLSIAEITLYNNRWSCDHHQKHYLFT